MLDSIINTGLICYYACAELAEACLIWFKIATIDKNNQ